MKLKRFQNTNPERGRKRLWREGNIPPQCSYFKTRTPKGDGNFDLHVVFHDKLLISKHEPRKGTETRASPSLWRTFSHFKARTPKGDGNPLATNPYSSPAASRFQNTNPERGRKHNKYLSLFMSILKFQNTNPERGRKLDALLEPLGRDSFQNTNPERGRKQFKAFEEKPLPDNYFKTRTPKGDGNPLPSPLPWPAALHFKTRTPKGDGNS